MLRIRSITLILALTACTSLPAPEPLNGHIPVSQNLRTQMQRMSNLIFERELTDEQMLYRRKQMAEGIAQGTRQLADELQAEDVDGHFESYIRLLREEAGRVAQVSMGAGTHISNAAIQRISQTCDDCHQASRRGWR